MKRKHYWSYFAIIQIRLVEGKIVLAVLLPHEAKEPQPFCHFQNLTRKCLLGIRGKSTARVIWPLGESDCFDWSSDKDNIHGLA